MRDIDRSLAFYTGVLGLKGERVQEFKEGKAGFPSVRINEHTIIDLFPEKGAIGAQEQGAKKAGNLNHYCLVVEKEDFAGIVDYLKERGVSISQGPVSR